MSKLHGKRWIAAAVLLTASAALADRVLIPPGSTWKYLSNGSDQGTAWRQPAFDDDYWPEGPAELGYGDGDEGTLLNYGGVATNKYISYYYRKRFWVDDAGRYPAVQVGFVNDDGGVVYLNGREIGRYNMPTGTFDYTTWATGEVSGAQQQQAIHKAQLHSFIIDSAGGGLVPQSRDADAQLGVVWLVRALSMPADAQAVIV